MAKQNIIIIFDLSDEEAYDHLFDYFAEEGYNECYDGKLLPSTTIMKEHSGEKLSDIRDQILAHCKEHSIELDDLMITLADEIVHHTDVECEEED